MRYLFFVGGFLLFIFSCQESRQYQKQDFIYPGTPYITVLGIAQDAGFPQANCRKSCCAEVWKNPRERQMVSCLGLVDPANNRFWLLDATPDFTSQLQILNEQTNYGDLGGIFLTHGHIGHYTGLMYLGREVMGADSVPVFAMPRMRKFLSTHGPWEQLVSLGNIKLKPLANDSTIPLSSDLEITPLQVPHRDEYTETVGYHVKGPEKQMLFIPDIDKWQKWDQDITQWIRKVDYAFLDGSFFQNGEIPGRDMSQIPHPFIEESMELFSSLSSEEKTKVHFIHFNHTNPVIHADSKERKIVEEGGFHLAREGGIFEL
jgi:pyrroloquinoline quinone biosynthesis protein B